jgi:predicted permease
MSLPAADTARVLSNTALHVFVPALLFRTTAAIVASSRLSVSCDTLRLASRTAVRKVMK